MKLVSLYASNFKNLDFDAPLRFQDGITVISGLNEAGKSTILDATLYALYSKVMKPPGRVRDEDLLAYNTGRATVILEFTIGEKLCKITREIRRAGTNTAILEEHLGQDRWKVIATKSREVTATVESLLGNISFDEMISSTIVAQKDLDRLVEQGADRWKVINAFLHLESFNEAVEALNEEKKNLEGTGSSRPGQINAERSKLDQLKRDLEEYRRRESRNQTLEQEVSALRGEIGKLIVRYDELRSLHGQLTKYDEISVQRQTATAKAEAKRTQLDGHRLAVSTFRRQLEEAKTEFVKYSNLPSDKEMTRVSELAQKIRVAESKISELQESIRAKAIGVAEAQKGIEGYDKAAIEKARSSRGSLLPYAAGSVTAFAAAIVSFVLLIPILALLTGAIGLVLLVLLARNVSRMNTVVKLEGVLTKFGLYEAKQKELQSLGEDLSKEESNRQDLASGLLGLLDEVTRYEQVAADKEPLQRAEVILGQFSTDAPKKGAAESSILMLTKGLDELTGQMDETSMEKQIAELNSEVADLVLPSLPIGVEFSKNLLAWVTEDQEAVGRQISSNQTRIESDSVTISENSEYMTAHKDIEENLRLQEEHVQQLVRRLKVIKAAKDGIEKTSESRRIRFRPGVEAYMGEILPSLTSGRYKAVMLDEGFGVQVFDPEAGEYRPKDVFSGGTEDQFLLAMRLAFALALTPEVKGTTPQFLWLDEPLGSSDEVRRSGIIEYLSASLSRLFSQIFIVSHVGGLEEQVPNVIRLEDGKIQKASN